MIVDFHSHFLPAIDDGADSPKTSVQMVNISKSQGVDILVATPHLLINNSPLHAAVAKRAAAYEAFKTEAEKTNFSYPAIKLGFEVRNAPGLLDAGDLDSLCIEGTKTILLEMPMSQWQDPLFENIETLIQKGYTVLLAHIERYLSNDRLEDVGRLLDMDVYSQVSASAFVSKQNRDMLFEMLENDMFHVLGSDAHNIFSRASFMDIAYRVISSHIGQKYIDKINENSAILLSSTKD